MMWEGIGAIVMLALLAYAALWLLRVNGEVLDLQAKLTRQEEAARKVQKVTKEIQAELDRLETWVLKDYEDQGETRTPPLPPAPRERRA